MPRTLSDYIPVSAESRADLAACRDLLRGGSRSFYAASFFLPSGVRQAATALYAFCRLADDAADDETAPDGGIERMHERLERAYAGRPLSAPVDRAFADVVEHFAIPRALPEALFEGFAWDAEGRRYPDLAALQAYGARVAGSVGAMMALLMGARDPVLQARACDLGVAMQLTNIARDVGEDARAGRLYLPLDWMADEGLDPEAWLARPRFDRPLGAVVQRLLDAADRLYGRADSGIAGLPWACRPGIGAARSLYAEIGRAVERQGYDSVSRRATVRSSRKLWLLAGVLARSALQRPAESGPALEETRFLVEAVAAAPLPHNRDGRSTAPWWDFAGNVVWVIELCERLEERDQALRSGSGA